MRITCISASRVPSSTANSIQAMKACQALAQLGHDIHLLVPKNSREIGIEDQALGKWEDLASFYGLKTQFSIEWILAQKQWKRYDFSFAAIKRAHALKADLLYVWPPQAAVLGLARGFPVMFELHGEMEGKLGPLLFRLFLSWPGRKRLLPISHALDRLLERQSGRKFTPGEVVISPNGVDLERYQGLPLPEEARRQLGLPEQFTACYTGHLYPGRGMELLVELARRFPEIHFLWVGGRQTDLEQWRSKLAVEKLSNVSTTGFVENSRLPLYQAAADVLLMPYERQIAGSSGGNSAEYCSPMKMFEYMACGRAILSSDLPVIHEVLNDKNARLCPPEDVEAWALTLAELRANECLRQELAQNAQAQVQSYSWTERARRALEGFTNEAS